MTICLPNSWAPRPYQRPMWEYFEGGGRRAVLLWHRRAGKDDNSLHFMATRVFERVATYWYMLPEYGQARKSMWEAINPHTGKRRLDEAFPLAIRAKTRETDMTIIFKNGSVLNFVGADNYNSVVGSPPFGIVMSEYSLTSPLAWAYLQPILEENGGWIIFNFTARGDNHAARLFKGRSKNPHWFTQKCLPAETGVFRQDQLREIREGLIELYGEDDGDALFQQEYNCSFAAALVGAYYAKLLARAETDKRRTRIPYDPALPVYTAWDLGVDDSTAIWVAQIVGLEVRLIDYYEANGQGLEHYVAWLKGRGYENFAEHFLPHDIEVQELGNGKTRIETLDSLGIRRSTVRVIPRMNPSERINAVRQLLPRCYFDEDKTAPGWDALANYRREFDRERKIYLSTPVHDWSSHGSDSFGHLAMGLKREKRDDKPKTTQKPANRRLC